MKRKETENYLKQTQSLDIVCLVKGEPVVDACGENEEIAG